MLAEGGGGVARTATPLSTVSCPALTPHYLLPILARSRTVGGCVSTDLGRVGVWGRGLGAWYTHWSVDVCVLQGMWVLCDATVPSCTVRHTLLYVYRVSHARSVLF